MSKSTFAEQIVEWAEKNGVKVFRHSPQNMQDMIGSDGNAVTITNGRKGTVIIDELKEYKTIDGKTVHH